MFGMVVGTYLDSQVAGNNRPLYPKVDHYWFKVAHNFEPLALCTSISIPIYLMSPLKEPFEGNLG